MDHNERFIRIEGLTKEFDVGRSFLEKGQKLRAVDNVSLDIKRGETLGLESLHLEDVFLDLLSQLKGKFCMRTKICCNLVKMKCGK